MIQESTNLPLTGIKGFTHHFRDDFKAAISVALVALPLGLGIALASGAPPMAGLIPPIIAGLITTFLRTSHLVINGPSAGLIVVVASGIHFLGGFEYVLAAIVISGVIKSILGLLKLGKLGNFFPASVVQGMLAGIGIIIMASQIHVSLGVEVIADSAYDSIRQLPNSLKILNPYVTIIAVFALLVLIAYTRIRNISIRAIPSALWVLFITIPITFIYDYLDPTIFESKFLITIPDNILDSILFPNFEKITELHFWGTVIAITFIGSIESIISTKAVEKLDRYKRKTDLDRDFLAVGISTIISGFIGGLPVLAVIVRSSVNINHEAKTKWSNFHHGILILLFVIIFPSLINLIPTAALSAILIYSGYRLAAPQVFRDVYRTGWEQVLVMVITLVTTIFTDLITGVLTGLISTIIIHYFLTGLEYKEYFKNIYQPKFSSFLEEDGKIHLTIDGIINFLSLHKLIEKLKTIDGKNIILDFSPTKLIDPTTLNYLHDYKLDFDKKGKLEIIGLDVHKTSSEYPNSLHIFIKPERYTYSHRQKDLHSWAENGGHKFLPDFRWEHPKFSNFNIFRQSIISYSNNNIKGVFENTGIEWTIYDVTYSHGILMSSEENKITLLKAKFDFELPFFALQKESIFDSISDLFSGGKIDKEEFRDFLDTFNLEYNNKTEVIKFFNKELRDYLLKNSYLNIETYRNELIIYSKKRILSVQEVKNLYENSSQISSIIVQNKTTE